MGFTATDLLSVPGKERGFDRHVFLLDSEWEDDRRRELLDNVTRFAGEVGRRVLVVQGYEPKQFTYEVLRAYGLEDEAAKGALSLALLISDVSPDDLMSQPGSKSKPVSVVLHLSELYSGHGSVTEVLREVAQTVKEPDALEVLRTMDRRRIKDRWGWISRYLEIKPSFFGFGANLGALLQDILAEGSARNWRVWPLARRSRDHGVK